ncbi:MAG: FlgD immunoglobulin-like domain containing protein [Candidatus Krumholzibacteria bacterium]|nr:FlgD immunoglobulin-like domain containing protein [Candidatus Krumholzibacteria bacterium]
MKRCYEDMPALGHAFVVLLVAAVLAAPPGAAAQVWRTGIIDAEGNSGTWCGVVRSPSGGLHAVYLRPDSGWVMTAAGLDTVWQAPGRVDTTGGSEGYCAIAVDASGARRFSWRDVSRTLLAFAGPEIRRDWDTGTAVATEDDEGYAISARRHGMDGVSVSYRNTTDGALEIALRDGFGNWSAPAIVDPGPDRGSHSDHAYHPAGGFVFSEYDGTATALLAVDSVLSAREWERGTAVAGADDEGQYPSMRHRRNGIVSVSYLNATGGSLGLVLRDSLGAWSAPEIVDPGPGRGTHSDHAWRPGIGYALSEYDGAGTALLFADRELAGRSWSTGTVMSAGNSGRLVSSVLAPDNRAASVFFHWDEATLGAVYYSATDAAGHSIVKAVEDTVAAAAGDGSVAMDLALTYAWDWHVAFYSPLDDALYYAYNPGYVITGTDEGNDPLPPVPSSIALRDVWPNPFNPAATIEYDIGEAGRVLLAVYDAAGRRVRTLVDGYSLPGRFRVGWDGCTDRGGAAASGVYFIRLESAGRTRTGKTVMLR